LDITQWTGLCRLSNRYPQGKKYRSVAASKPALTFRRRHGPTNRHDATASQQEVLARDNAERELYAIARPCVCPSHEWISQNGWS